MVTETKKGREIRDKVFNGNPHEQLSLLRKGIWALAVLNDEAMSQINNEHKKIFDEYDLKKAKGYQKLLIEYNDYVEKILDEYPEVSS